jgi:hypothetical protein
MAADVEISYFRNLAGRRKERSYRCCLSLNAYTEDHYRLTEKLLRNCLRLELQAVIGRSLVSANVDSWSFAYCFVVLNPSVDR